MNKTGERFIVFAVANSPQLMTGVRQYVNLLVGQLKRDYRGVDIVVVVSEEYDFISDLGQHSDVLKVTVPKNEITPIFKRKGLMQRLLNFLFCNKGNDNTYNKMFENIEPGLVFYTVYSTFSDFPRWANNNGYKVVSVVHDIRAVSRLNNSATLGNIKSFVSNMRHLTCIINSSCLVLVPNAYVKGFLKKFFSSNNLYESFAVPEISRTTRALVNKGTRQYLYFPATIIESKYHIHLLQLFLSEKVRGSGLRLVLTGTNWDSSLGCELQEFIIKHELSPYVEHLGFVSRDDQEALYRNALATVFPTRDESFNLGIWESFAFGSPVICSDDKELLMQVEGAACVFKFGDIQDLESKVFQLLRSEVVREEYIRKGRERYRNCAKGRLLSNEVIVKINTIINS